MRQITDMATRDFVISMLSTGEYDLLCQIGLATLFGMSYVDNHGSIEVLPTKTKD
jgi:hypothetical protein